MPVGLEDRCAALFDEHRVEAFGGTFHVPDRDSYPALFAWDSGYHALSLLHLDARRRGGGADHRCTGPTGCPTGCCPISATSPGRTSTSTSSRTCSGRCSTAIARRSWIPPRLPTPRPGCPWPSAAPADPLLDARRWSHLRALARTRTVGGAGPAGGAAPVRDRHRGQRPDARPSSPVVWAHPSPRLKELTITGRAAGMAPDVALRGRARFRRVRPHRLWVVPAGPRGGGRRLPGPGPRQRRRRSSRPWPQRWPGTWMSLLWWEDGTHLRRLRPHPVPSIPRHRGHGPDPRRQPRPGAIGPVPTGRRAPPPSGRADVGALRLRGRQPSPRERRRRLRPVGRQRRVGRDGLLGLPAWPPGSAGGTRPADCAANSRA